MPRRYNPQRSGLIEDRRGQVEPLMPGTIPKMPILSDLQKRVIDPPWTHDDRSFIAAGAKEQPADISWPYTQYLPTPAEREASKAALAAAIRRKLQMLRVRPPERRSGV